MKALSAAFSALLVTSLAHSAPQYQLNRVDTYAGAVMNGINAYGDIVGTFTVDNEGPDYDGPLALYLQYKFFGETAVLPPLFLGPRVGHAGAVAINDYGKVVGFAYSPQTFLPVPVAWYTSGG